MSEYRTNSSLRLEFSYDDALFDAYVYDDTAGEHRSTPIASIDTVKLLTLIAAGHDRQKLFEVGRSRIGLTKAETEDRLQFLSENGLIVVEDEEPISIQDWNEHDWDWALDFFLQAKSFDLSDAAGEPDTDVREPTAVGSTRSPETEIELPEPSSLPDTTLESCLLGRRTCRTFRQTEASDEQISTMLSHTFAPMKRAELGNDDGYADLLTASYFGIDPYLLVLRSDSLETGIYEYGIDGNAVTPVAGFDSPESATERLSELVYEQPYPEGAAFCVVFAGDFETYGTLRPTSMGLREIYANVSSHVHRLLLVATALGYDVWQSAALRDKELNEMLGIDGHSESVLYVVAVGKRDSRSKKSWASPNRPEEQ